MLTMPDAIALASLVLGTITGLIAILYKKNGTKKQTQVEEAYWPAHMELSDRLGRHEERIKNLESWMHDLDDKYERILEKLSCIEINMAKEHSK